MSVHPLSAPRARLAWLGQVGALAGLLEAIRLWPTPWTPWWFTHLTLAWGGWWLLALSAGLIWALSPLAEEARPQRPGAQLASALTLLLGAGAGFALARTVIAPAFSPRYEPAVAALGSVIGLAMLWPGRLLLLDGARRWAARPGLRRMAEWCRRRPLIGSMVGWIGILACTWGLGAWTPRWLPAVAPLAAFWWHRTRPDLQGVLRLGWGWAGVGLFAALIGLGAAALTPAAPLRATAAQGLITGWALLKLEQWSDDDGDGSGDLFGGLDCDDADPTRHPAAMERPGNGVDENCRGGDSAHPFERAALPAGPRQSRKKPHLILLVIDAMRADHLTPALTPGLAAEARKGVQFSRAYSTSSATRMAIPALMASRWISHTHYAEAPGRYWLDARVPVLAEVLAEVGYQTAAVVPPFVFNRLRGLSRGFGRFVPHTERTRKRRGAGRSTPRLVHRALSWLEAADQAGPKGPPLFLFLHADDAHAPYTAHGVKPDPGPRPLDRYRAELKRLDADLAPLLEAIHQRQDQRPVRLIITADHGEAFGAHGRAHHGLDLFEDVLRVPLVLVGDGLPAGRRIQQPVDLLDVGATLAHWGRATLPGAQGSALDGLIAGRPLNASRPLFAEIRVLYPPFPTLAAVVDGDWKLITRWDTGAQQLFDLTRGENRPVASTRGETPREALSRHLMQWAEGGQGPGGRLKRVR